MDDKKILEGKVALVTGSSTGLGLIFAEGLARRGATVILNGRNNARLSKAVFQLSEDGLEIHGECFDIADTDEVKKSVENIERNFGSIDVLINNAGMQHRSALEHFPVDIWEQLMRTNLTGPFLVAQAVARGMIKRGGGKIVNVCSLQADLGRKTIAPYAASKGGLKMLTRAMCVEWAQYNIQVNAIGPGYFATEMTQPLRDDPAFDNWLRNRTPAGRWGEPKELLPALELFVSPASEFINGQIIYVDGGITAAI